MWYARTRKLADSRALRSALLAGAVLVLGAGRVSAQEDAASRRIPQGTAEVTAVELYPGSDPGTFALRIRVDEPREYVSYWVSGSTFVVDLRDTYTPYRGQNVGALETPDVQAVRASQFLDRDGHIARIEIDVAGSKSAEAAWSGSSLDVRFAPGSPEFRGTGRTRPPAAEVGVPRERPAEQAAAASGEQREQVDQPPGARYQRGLRENPFDPLLKPSEADMTNVLERPLPNAEALTLTGVVYREDDPGQSTALFRDAQGLTYRLKVGDRVRFGYLTRITATEVVFTLDKYGRRIEVRLPVP
ncbi:MAG: hypothetical protein R6W82_11105 [bacterium]